MAIKNENRRMAAQTLLERTINRTDSKLEKIPLPIGSKDRHFNFERMINENVPYHRLRLLVGGGVLTHG
jgi:hypothetical protein